MTFHIKGATFQGSIKTVCSSKEKPTDPLLRFFVVLSLT